MVVSPKNLWMDYDRSLTPLAVTEIYSGDCIDGKEKRVYFNGDATKSGCTRIYARLLLPLQKTDRVVLFFPDVTHDIGALDFASLLQEGWAVLAVDYAGNIDERVRFTIYPSELDFANYKSENVFSDTDIPQNTCQYVWTTVCLRALTYAESEGFTRVALLGVGLGGAQVFKTAALTSFPICAITLFSPGFFPPHDDTELISANISLDVTGYSPLLKIPLLQICCSNDSDSSLDAVSELSEQASGKSILYIAPRCDRSFTDEIKTDILRFFSFYGSESDKKFIMPPSLTASGAETKLYFSLKCDIVPSELALYVSHGVTHPSYRNWRTVSLQKAGENEYIGYTEVYSYDKPIYAFAGIKTKAGFIYSSPVIKKIPSVLNVTPTSIIKRRLIYDSDMGSDDFFISGSSAPPSMKAGPFDINGICATKGLCTYKIGDVAYSGERDGILQLLLFSPVTQTITFTVTDGDQFSSYTCVKTVSPENDWEKITLSASDFKSPERNLLGWDKAIFLRIDAENEILINSLLWV